MTAETHTQLANVIWSICKVGYEIPLNRHFYV